MKFLYLFVLILFGLTGYSQQVTFECYVSDTLNAIDCTICSAPIDKEIFTGVIVNLQYPSTVTRKKIHYPYRLKVRAKEFLLYDNMSHSVLYNIDSTAYNLETMMEWFKRCHFPDSIGFDTDSQSLNIISDTLHISRGNYVNLKPYKVDTDSQSLNIINDTLYISRGNYVNLKPYNADTDSQSLSIDGMILSISRGNSVNLSALIDSYDLSTSGSLITTLVGSGTSVQYVEGAGIDIAFSGTSANAILTFTNTSLNTDAQILSITGGVNPVLNISGASSPISYIFTGGTFTSTGSSVTWIANDQSSTNELQTFSHTYDSGLKEHVTYLSNSGGLLSLRFMAGFTIGNVISGNNSWLDITANDQSATNEIQTLSGNGARVTTLSLSGGTFTLNSGNSGITITQTSGANPVYTFTNNIIDTDTDKQKIDTFGIVSNMLRISLEGDLVPFLFADLTPYLPQTYAHNHTTNHYDNILSNSGGTWSLDVGAGLTLTGTAGAMTLVNTVVDTDTDNQTLSITDVTTKMQINISEGDSILITEGIGINLVWNSASEFTINSTIVDAQNLSYTGSAGGPTTLNIDGTGTTDVTLTAGNNITFNRVGSDLTINANTGGYSWELGVNGGSYTTITNMEQVSISEDANTDITISGNVVSIKAIPSGNNTNVQFNNSGVFGGSDNFTWDGTNVGVIGGHIQSGKTAIGLTALKNPIIDVVTGIGTGSADEVNSIRLRQSSTDANTMVMRIGVSNVGIGGANQGYGYISTPFWGGSDYNPLILNPLGGQVGVAVTQGLSDYNLKVKSEIGIGSVGSDANNALAGRLTFTHHDAYVAKSAYIAGIRDKSQWYQGMGIVFATVSGVDISSTAGLERMRITSDGDVGIGDTLPTQKLHVRGNVRVTGAYYDSNNEAGTSGQVLSSTVTGTDWVTNMAGGTDLTFTGSGSTFTLNSNTGSDVTFTEGDNIDIERIVNDVSIRAYPSGSNRYVQYNASGIFGADTGFVYNTNFVAITLSNDWQLVLSGGQSHWAGIKFTDTIGTDYIYFRGSTETFSIGGNGSSVSGKKLHIDGGTTIGASYDGSNTNTNGLAVEGNVSIGNNAASQPLHVTGNARVTGAYYDSNNEAGTSGQFLSSTVTGTDWISSTPTGTDLTFTGSGSPFTLNSSTGTDVTFSQGGIITLIRSGNDLQIIATEIDSSITNELQYLNSTGSGFITTTLSSSGGSLTINAGDNITIVRTGTGLDGIATISSTDNYVDSLIFYDDTDTLKIGRTGSLVDIKVKIPDTDSQSLSIIGNIVSISRGNSITLPTYADADNFADSLTFNISSRILTLGRTGSLISLFDTIPDIDTDSQSLSIIGSVLSISRGNSINISGIDTDNYVDAVSYVDPTGLTTLGRTGILSDLTTTIKNHAWYKIATTDQPTNTETINHAGYVSINNSSVTHIFDVAGDGSDNDLMRVRRTNSSGGEVLIKSGVSGYQLRLADDATNQFIYLDAVSSDARIHLDYADDAKIWFSANGNSYFETPLFIAENGFSDTSGRYLVLSPARVMFFGGGLADRNNNIGIAGYILSSTGTQVQWIPNTSGSTNLAFGGIGPFTLTSGGGTAVTFTEGANIDITSTVSDITIKAYPTGSNTYVQYNNSGTFGGNSGFIYDGTDVGWTGKLSNTSTNSSAAEFQLGSIYLQGSSLNNSLISDNAFYNGSSFIKSSTGYASGLQFLNSQILFWGENTGTGTFTQDISMKIDYTGKFVLGAALSSTLANYTGATFYHDPSAPFTGIGTTNLSDPISGNSFFKIVQGTQILSFKDNWLASSNGTITALVSHTNPTDGYVIGSYTNHDFVLRSNNLNRVIIDAGGNVGIGTNASPTQPLHVTGNVRVTGAYYDSNNEAGTNGQLLKSTVTGTDWVSANDTSSINEIQNLLPYIVSGDTLGFLLTKYNGTTVTYDTVSFYGDTTGLSGLIGGGGGGGADQAFVHTSGINFLLSTLSLLGGSIRIEAGTQIEVLPTIATINGIARIKTNFNGCQDCVGFFGANAGFVNDSVMTDSLFRFFYDEGIATLQVPTITLTQTTTYTNPVALYIGSSTDERVYTSNVDASGFTPANFYHKITSPSSVSIPSGYTGPATHYFINDGFAFTLNRSAAETIDGSTSQSFTANDRLVILSNDGAGKWYTNKASTATTITYIVPFYSTSSTVITYVALPSSTSPALAANSNYVVRIYARWYTNTASNGINIKMNGVGTWTATGKAEVPGSSSTDIVNHQSTITSSPGAALTSPPANNRYLLTGNWILSTDGTAGSISFSVINDIAGAQLGIDNVYVIIEKI